MSADPNEESFSPDVFHLSCMNTRTISADGNKYFAAGAVLGMGASSLLGRA